MGAFCFISQEFLMTSLAAAEAVRRARERDYNFNLKEILQTIRERVEKRGEFIGRTVGYRESEKNYDKLVKAGDCRLDDVEKALSEEGCYHIEYTKRFWGLLRGVRITKKKGA
jgi:hypothetical protein